MAKNIQNVNDLINSNVHAKEYYLKLSEAARGNVNLKWILLQMIPFV